MIYLFSYLKCKLLAWKSAVPNLDLREWFKLLSVRENTDIIDFMNERQ